MDAPIAEPVVIQEPVTPESSPSNDLFSLDDSRLASLSPEQRATLGPVIEEWKSKAKEEVQKTGKTYEDKYKPHAEKAQALDQLVQDPRFQTWWRNVQTGVTQQNPQAAGAIQGSQPQDFATPEEWQNAMAEAYQGDPTRLKSIQTRMFATLASPVIQQLKEGQEQLRSTLEMKDLFERHTDAKELDLIGRDATNPNDQSKSLLEFALEWADANKKPLEEGYQLAKRWSAALQVKEQQKAMGMVQEKKASVTSGPSTNQPTGNIVEVADADELMEKNMEYLASGQKPPKFVIRSAQKQNSWAQRT